MKSFIAALSLVLITSQALAYDIEALHYDATTKTVTVSLVFNGGLQVHNFQSVFEPCNRSTHPYGQAVRLWDSGWQDTGTDLHQQEVTFNIQDTSCLPAELTVFVGRDHASINIK